MAGPSWAPVLPTEILHLVFENLNEHSDFYSLCLVSRYFYGTAIRFLYRRVILPYRPCDSKEAFAAPLNALFSSAQQRDFAKKPAAADPPTKPYRDLSGCGEFVKYFKFDQSNIRGAVGGGEVVEAAIENMSRLESFVWQSVTTTTTAAAASDNLRAAAAAAAPPPPAAAAGTIVRTPRISNALASKPNLRHLSLGKFFVDTDIPLLRLNPLRSFSFTLDSSFASFAHRRFPNLLSERTVNSPPGVSAAGDYDIIRKILQTSAKTLRVLSLRSSCGSSSGGFRPQYSDEQLLFGGAACHVSSFPEAPAEVMLRLEKLEGLSISERLFTDSGVEVLTKVVDFARLRYLAVQNCAQVEKLLGVLAAVEFRGLRRLVVQASQSVLAGFIGSFEGLQELVVNVEGEALDWTAPGGLRRRFSTGEVVSGLVDAIGRHGRTLRSLSFVSEVSQIKKVFFKPAALQRLVESCAVLRDLRICINFSEWPGVVTALSTSTSLTRVYIHQRELLYIPPPHLDLEAYYRPGVTRAERQDLCARCYLQDLVCKNPGLRGAGVGYHMERVPCVYRVVPEGLKRVRFREGRRRWGFWERGWGECVGWELGEDY